MTVQRPVRDETAEANLLLQVWTSPAFPVGAFVYSHGIEWAVEAGDIADAASLANWLGDLLTHGAPRNDAILFGHAWRTARNSDTVELCKANALALALANSRERYLETSAQGNAFLAIARTAWPCGALDCMAAAIETDEPVQPVEAFTPHPPHGEKPANGCAQSAPVQSFETPGACAGLWRPSRTTSFDTRPAGAAQDDGRPHPVTPRDCAYPIAFAVTAAAHGIGLAAALEAFILAFIANLISAAVRLGSIGQTDGQRVTAQLLPEVRALAAFAADASLDDLGGAAFRSDLAALRHETQYSRLFRS